jgi:hypothetical protein
MVISPEKFETMAILGRDPVRCKIAVGNKCLQKSKDFKYVGCEIFYENGKDMQQKLAQFAQILRIMYNTFKPTLVQKCSRIKVLVIPILVYEGEI